MSYHFTGVIFSHGFITLNMLSIDSSSLDETYISLQDGWILASISFCALINPDLVWVQRELGQ